MASWTHPGQYLDCMTRNTFKLWAVKVRSRNLILRIYPRTQNPAFNQKNRADVATRDRNRSGPGNFFWPEVGGGHTLDSCGHGGESLRCQLLLVSPRLSPGSRSIPQSHRITASL